MNEYKVEVGESFIFRFRVFIGKIVVLKPELDTGKESLDKASFHKGWSFDKRGV